MDYTDVTKWDFQLAVFLQNFFTGALIRQGWKREAYINSLTDWKITWYHPDHGCFTQGPTGRIWYDFTYRILGTNALKKEEPTWQQ